MIKRNIEAVIPFFDGICRASLWQAELLPGFKVRAVAQQSIGEDEGTGLSNGD